MPRRPRGRGAAPRGGSARDARGEEAAAGGGRGRRPGLLACRVGGGRTGPAEATPGKADSKATEMLQLEAAVGVSTPRPPWATGVAALSPAVQGSCK